MARTTTIPHRTLGVLVILLAFSHLLMCLKAVPITRSESLMQGSQGHAVLVLQSSNHKDEDMNKDEKTERMDLELLDYQPPGANGHHTPKAP
ncbi:hypothetical protein HN51_063029 [Arachis hypogaea]|uniref:Uncharacterized protein n=1 Tax=Arachis hypogaea TaxID=3818 RepID=A0A445AZU0_ARAHY|nr:uncharacterized protein LOC107618956 [Arachis ipaensis]XP_025629347.1 uncharacterized protein LOC112722506 [Arachis hypogaea]QHO20593.1 uncharacterized protein DS421_11g339290 [Arachis hypogaea]RYR31910.1 hypothetical protein Ahy_B01g056861 [Arachis hypogaea]